MPLSGKVYAEDTAFPTIHERRFERWSVTRTLKALGKSFGTSFIIKAMSGKPRMRRYPSGPDIHIAHGVVGSNTYAMAALIEDCRQAERNPKLPGNLKEAYFAALDQLSEVGLIELRHAEDRELASSIIALIAMQKGLPVMGKFAMLFSEDQRREILHDAGWL